MAGKNKWSLGLDIVFATYLALCELCESLVRKDDSDIGFWFRFALVYGTGLLQVNGPDDLLAAFILHLQFEDAVRLCMQAR